jgi:hypothetical protein
MDDCTFGADCLVRSLTFRVSLNHFQMQDVGTRFVEAVTFRSSNTTDICLLVMSKQIVRHIWHAVGLIDADGLHWHGDVSSIKVQRQRERAHRSALRSKFSRCSGTCNKKGKEGTCEHD